MVKGQWAVWAISSHSCGSFHLCINVVGGCMVLSLTHVIYMRFRDLCLLETVYAMVTLSVALCVCVCVVLSADHANYERQSTADVTPGPAPTTEWPAPSSTVPHFITAVIVCHVLSSYACHVLWLWQCCNYLYGA